MTSNGSSGAGRNPTTFPLPLLQTPDEPLLPYHYVAVRTLLVYATQVFGAFILPEDANGGEVLHPNKVPIRRHQEETKSPALQGSLNAALAWSTPTPGVRDTSRHQRSITEQVHPLDLNLLKDPELFDLCPIGLACPMQATDLSPVLLVRWQFQFQNSGHTQHRRSQIIGIVLQLIADPGRKFKKVVTIRPVDSISPLWGPALPAPTPCPAAGGGCRPGHFLRGRREPPRTSPLLPPVFHRILQGRIQPKAGLRKDLSVSLSCNRMINGIEPSNWFVYSSSS